MKTVQDLSAIPWWMGLAVVLLFAGAWWLARRSVDYRQLRNPDYLDDQTEYRARIDPIADHPWGCRCPGHR